jgi:hypothetical protein
MKKLNFTNRRPLIPSSFFFSDTNLTRHGRNLGALKRVDRCCPVVFDWHQNQQKQKATLNREMKP